jgi:hypothetical protein
MTRYDAALETFVRSRVGGWIFVNVFNHVAASAGLSASRSSCPGIQLPWLSHATKPYPCAGRHRSANSSIGLVSASPTTRAR